MGSYFDCCKQSQKSLSISDAEEALRFFKEVIKPKIRSKRSNERDMGQSPGIMAWLELIPFYTVICLCTDTLDSIYFDQRRPDCVRLNGKCFDNLIY
jgi:hypothetical protein